MGLSVQKTVTGVSPLSVLTPSDDATHGCTEKETDSTGECKAVRRRRHAIKYLVPYLTRAAAAGKAKAETANKDRLYIHMRGSDMIGFYKGHQPPCVLYKQVIEGGYNGGKFPHVTILTESLAHAGPDGENPCVPYVMKLFPYTVIQNNTIAEDAGTMIGAVNLMVARSTFSISFAFLNDNLERLFMPSGLHIVNDMPDSEVPQDYYPCGSTTAKGSANTTLWLLKERNFGPNQVGPWYMSQAADFTDPPASFSHDDDPTKNFSRWWMVNYPEHSLKKLSEQARCGPLDK